MSTTATWIFERTSAGGGGETAAPAPPVANLAATLTPRNNQQVEVAVTYTLDATATAQNFAGVAIYLEDPDISSAPPMTLDGRRPLDGTSGTSARWIPVFENNNHSTWTSGTESHGPADILVNYSAPFQNRGMSRNVRIYLASFGPDTNAILVRATQPNPTPSVVVTIPQAPPIFVRGEEYAWLVTNATVALETDFNRPDPTYRLQFSYTPPDSSISIPPGMNPFGGVEIFYTYPDAKNTDPLYAITDSGVFVPMTSSAGYQSPAYDPGNGGTFRVYFCSADNSQPAHVNSLIPGVTPYQEVTVVYPPVDGGGNPLPTTPDITGLALSNPRMVWQPDGSMLAEIDATWTNPTSPSYGGLEFYVTAISPPDANYKLPMQLADIGNNVTTTTFSVLKWPKTTEQWTITAISLDAYNKQNNDPNNPRSTSMQAIWTIGPPGPGGTGQEVAPLVTPLALPTPTFDQQVSNDGVQMMRFKLSGWTNPTSNQFGGVKIAMVDNDGTVYWDAGKQTTFTTPWLTAVTAQRIYFYWVSYNPQNQQNTIVPQPGGQTPYAFVDFTPSPGAIKASQIPSGWWSTSEFAWPTYPASGGFQANIIEAGKIAVGSVLRVGGAPSSSPFAPSFQGQNGQVAVYSSGSDPGDVNGQPTLRAWMGQQNTPLPGGAGGIVYGGWFSALYVGGTGPPTSPFYVNNGGVVIVGGWDVQGTAYPYISIRNERNVETGRIGARLNMGPDPNSAVGGSAPALAGAWFNQFAIGGANLSDWRLLAAGDNTIKIRNINQFEIDYNTNVAPVPPYNAPYKLLLGTDIAYTAVGQNKFPGITLMRMNSPNNTHGVTVINRGIILTADDPGVTQNQRIALVTFNGDYAGGDTTPFWGELVMFAPTTGNQNVTFNSGGNSGTLNGSPSLTMTDDHGNLNFQVRNSGDVVIGHQLLWGPSAVTVIDNTGAWTGAIKAPTLTAGAYYVTGISQAVINSSGDWTGGNIYIGPSHWINCGQITSSNLYIFVGGVAKQVIDGYGNWVGNPITGAQTPWAQDINASSNSLTGIKDITSKDSTYYLHNQPAYSGDHILEIAGPGILLMPTGGGFGRLDLQYSGITLLNSSQNSVFTVDLNGNIVAASIGVVGNVGAAGFQTAGKTGVTGTFKLTGTDNNVYTCSFTNGILTSIA